SIMQSDVHTTCERCVIADCSVRAAEPVIQNKRRRIREIEDRLQSLIEE
ncbi:MAG: hypothetical protein HRU40_22340, partial [Saprospiraceae bacterium]|nr:hypothetical protein [Saprospiraceae bacterium]